MAQLASADAEVAVRMALALAHERALGWCASDTA